MYGLIQNAQTSSNHQGAWHRGRGQRRRWGANRECYYYQQIFHSTHRVEIHIRLPAKNVYGFPYLKSMLLCCFEVRTGWTCSSRRDKRWPAQETGPRQHSRSARDDQRGISQSQRPLALLDAVLGRRWLWVRRSDATGSGPWTTMVHIGQAVEKNSTTYAGMPFNELLRPTSPGPP